VTELNKLGLLVFKYIHLLLKLTVYYAQSMGKNIAISASNSNYVLLLTESIFKNSISASNSNYVLLLTESIF